MSFVSAAITSNLRHRDPPDPSDEFWDNVVLLAPFSSDFNDVSSNANTGTGNNSAAINSSQQLFGLNTLDLTVSEASVSFADIAAYNLGGSDFTWEFHLNLSNVTTRVLAGGGQVGAGGTRSWFTAFDGSVATKVLYYYYSTDGSTYLGQYGNFPFSPTIGQWYHIAWVRDGANMRCFIDGTEATAGASNPMGTLFNSTVDFMVGDVVDTATAMNGYLANVRLTNGVKRYTTGFSPPTAPYPTQ